MKIYETQNRRMRRNFAQSVDVATFDYNDPLEDKDRRQRVVGMVDVALVNQRAKLAVRKPFEEIDTASAFQTKVEFGTWMDKFQHREGDRIDSYVTSIMQKYCTPRAKDLKVGGSRVARMANSIDMTRTADDFFPRAKMRQEDSKTELSTKNTARN